MNSEHSNGKIVYKAHIETEQISETNKTYLPPLQHSRRPGRHCHRSRLRLLGRKRGRDQHQSHTRCHRRFRRRPSPHHLKKKHNEKVWFLWRIIQTSARKRGTPMRAGRQTTPLNFFQARGKVLPSEPTMWQGASVAKKSASSL